MHEDKSIRVMSLVKLAPDLERFRSNYPFAVDMPLVYLGEIVNMPGHGVFVSHKSGRIYSGYHIDSFVELSEEEV